MSEAIDFFDTWPLEAEVGRGAARDETDSTPATPETMPASPAATPSAQVAAPDRLSGRRTLQAPPGAPFPHMHAPTPLGRRDDEEHVRPDPAATRTSRWRSARGAAGPSTPPPRPPLPPASGPREDVRGAGGPGDGPAANAPSGIDEHPAGDHPPTAEGPSTVADRPAVDDRPTIGDRPAIADRSAIGDPPAIGDRAPLGDPPAFDDLSAVEAAAELRRLIEAVAGPVLDPADLEDEQVVWPEESETAAALDPGPTPGARVSAETSGAASNVDPPAPEPARAEPPAKERAPLEAPAPEPTRVEPASAASPSDSADVADIAAEVPDVAELPGVAAEAPDVAAELPDVAAEVSEAASEGPDLAAEVARLAAEAADVTAEVAEVTADAADVTAEVAEVAADAAEVTPGAAEVAAEFAKVAAPQVAPPARRPLVGRAEAPPSAADILREIALPHLELLAARLRKARHDAVVQDALHGLEPALRFHFRPWQGPFEEVPHGRAIVLEIASGRAAGGADQVLARYRVEPDDPTATIELRAPVESLDARWVERRVVDFLERALERA